MVMELFGVLKEIQRETAKRVAKETAEKPARNFVLLRKTKRV
jgi:hypothetical protein